MILCFALAIVASVVIWRIHYSRRAARLRNLTEHRRRRSDLKVMPLKSYSSARGTYSAKPSTAPLRAMPHRTESAD